MIKERGFALAKFERICDHCGKLFMVQTGEAYVFKIGYGTSFKWYCCWSHYRIHAEKKGKKNGHS